MKTSLKPILLLCSAFVLIGLQSCKDQATEETDNSRRLTSTKLDDNKVVVERESSSRSYRGEFLYVADAAVLKGEDFIYAVKLDSMSMALAERVKPIQESEFDMVKVIVSGTLEPKPADAEGWDEILTITQIHYVNDTPEKADIKLETN
jgi:hypothetical protein